MTDHVVTVEGLTRRFGNDRGVEDVSFEIERGEIFGFLGPNGSGKSTTIRLLLGLYRPGAGRVRIFGLDPQRDGVRIHRRVGYLPGELALHPRLTGRAHLHRCAHARGLVDTSYRDELIERFDVELDRPVSKLSKGNRQKIGIVIAFMHRPDLLVLDEPTSGLDPLLQDQFARLMRETADDGRTVLLSSHELDEVQRVVDRLSIIKSGRIVVTDSIEGLRSTAPRTIEFRFARPFDPAVFAALDGVHVTEHERDRIAISLTGPVAPVLRVAADLEPTELTARPADLDDLFLSYYRTSSEADCVR